MMTKACKHVNKQFETNKNTTKLFGLDKAYVYSIKSEIKVIGLRNVTN